MGCTGTGVGSTISVGSSVADGTVTDGSVTRGVSVSAVGTEGGQQAEIEIKAAVNIANTVGSLIVDVLFNLPLQDNASWIISRAFA
jgi:hypothetical protein